MTGIDERRPFGIARAENIEDRFASTARLPSQRTDRNGAECFDQRENVRASFRVPDERSNLLLETARYFESDQPL